MQEYIIFSRKNTCKMCANDFLHSGKSDLSKQLRYHWDFLDTPTNKSA